MTRATALQIYKHLPGKDCAGCGEKTCMAYAMKLSKGEKTKDCPLLAHGQKNVIKELLAPAIAAVKIGLKESAVNVGGEEVLYRHEYKYVNPPALFIEIADNMTAGEIDKRIYHVKNFAAERFGQKQRLDGIAVKCASGEKNRFAKTVELVTGKFDGPIILSAEDPNNMEAGASAAKDRKPLLYAATKENWEEMLRIAKKYATSLAIRSQDTVGLRKLAKDISTRGFSDLVLDPCATGETDLRSIVDRFTMLRKEAVAGAKECGHPLMCSTASMCMEDYDESMLAGLLVCRYASIIIMRTIEPWALLPVLTLRQSLYSDPSVEPSVEAKLYSVGTPNKDSPLIVTTNFALTYYSVSNDLAGAGISSYLLVVDTGGLAVTVSLAAEKLTAQAIKDALVKNNVKEKIGHKRLIIPGAAAQLKTDLEKATGWTVLTGPQDSSALPAFLKESRKA
jgi:acetyl-CoA decarbonylase/synthase complex subunit gamma